MELLERAAKSEFIEAVTLNFVENLMIRTVDLLAQLIVELLTTLNQRVSHFRECFTCSIVNLDSLGC